MWSRTISCSNVPYYRGTQDPGGQQEEHESAPCLYDNKPFNNHAITMTITMLGYAGKSINSRSKKVIIPLFMAVVRPCLELCLLLLPPVLYRKG